MVEIIEVTKFDGGEKKNEAVEKKTGGDGGGKKDDASASAATTIVLKLDLHCDGCAKKVRRSILHLEGVEDVKADYESGKLTVKGKVDPTWLRERVEIKTKRKVELLSPPPKKDAGAGTVTGGDKKSDAHAEKKAEEENKIVDDKKPQKPIFNTIDLKISLHCDGCAHKIKRIIKRVKGVEKVSVALQNNLVTVKGTMDIKELTPYLKDKLKRSIDIFIPKKDDHGDQKKTKEGGDDNKEKEGGSGSGDENKQEGGDNNNKKNDDETKLTASSRGGDGSNKSIERKEQKIEVVNKMDYYGNNTNTYYAMSAYNTSYMNHDHHGVALYDHGYDRTGYVMEYSHGQNYVPPSPPPTYLNTPNLFSDEDPNGCSVM